MGTPIPKKVAHSAISEGLTAGGMKRIHQGKVRDTYEISGHPNLLLPIATNRLSIYDFVLPGVVEHKGEVLTALTVFWLTKVVADEKHHLVAYGRGIDEYLPEPLRGNAELQKRALVVKKLQMLPVECVARGYLTGSGWSSYRESQEVCGHKLADGLHDGARLPEPIFTPTTKAEEGHDEPISFQSVRDEYGDKFEKLTIDIYRQILEYSLGHGIILADTKFEFSSDGVLADEVATPDSSRFWDVEDWKAAVKEKKSPSGYDKQPVREWGKTVATPFEKGGEKITGIHKLDSGGKEHIEFVHGLEVPPEVLTATTERYKAIFEKLTGVKLSNFQKNEMGIG